jgi:hypothetical protein
MDTRHAKGPDADNTEIEKGDAAEKDTAQPAKRWCVQGVHLLLAQWL